MSQKRGNRASRAGDEIAPLEDDPLWFKDAVIYEVHVRTFHDSDGDGVGDFQGLTEKLDYLQDLGVTAIWLLPFSPSPLKDEGYDTSDYTGVHPLYGNVADFRTFLREAHRRGLRVITELVVNHTSDQHDWFQRSRRAAPGSSWRNYYVWSDTPERYKEARIIFKDFESSNWSWDPVAKAYFWHRFYSHQPDLNYDDPGVRKAVLGVLDFWMGMGVDGVRLDAVPYLFERDGTDCENLPETHAFLKEMRRHIDAKFPNRLFLAEANQWPEDSVAYFGAGDECHMNFHFPLMPRLFMAIRMEDRFPVIDILQQTPPIPDNCQWAMFLRNHDELTLEMVTDDERDYMYRAYAHDPQARVNLGIRRRLAPLLGNDRKRIELMSGLLYSLPGTPVIYYGDEIGMGDNIYLGDRNGVRTPMQWNADRNAGFSRANPQRLYLPFIIDPEYHYESVNVENQQNNPHSLLWWTKRVISLRKRYKAFGRGSIDFLQPENRKVLAFVRRWQDQKLLVVANLSRFAQHVALDLSAFQGQTLLELFGKTRFPVIGDSPYALTLGAHTFYWFSIEPAPAQADAAARADLPRLSASGNWRNLLRGRAKATFEAVLPAYLGSRRWFLGKTRTILSVDVRELAAIPREEPAGVVALVRVAYRDGEPESYLLPLAFTPADRATAAIDAGVAVARLVVRTAAGEIEGVLHDALWDRAFANAVLAVAASAERLRADPGVIEASPTAPFRERLESISEFPEPSVVRADQSNTSVVYGDAFVLKLFRRLEDGPNPDAEIGRYLTEKSTFANAAPLASTLEFRRGRDMPSTLAVLHAYVPHQLDGWRHTMDALGRFFEDVLARTAEPTPSAPSAHVLDLVGQDIPPLAHELVGLYLEDARRLGRRTAELHLALAAADDPALAPEPFTDFYRRGQYQGMVSLLNRTMPLLRERLAELPEAERADAERVLASEAEIRKRFLPFRDHRISTIRIRCHGDYHLGQVLHTGKDFVIFDFEGEADRPLSVRRLKRSALRDVAGMLRSFQYAAYSALIGQIAGVRPEDFAPLAPWASWWQAWVSSAFLRSYLEGAGNAPFVPTSREEFHVMLDAFVLEKAIHELGYELANRARWVRVALVGLRQLIET